MFLRDDVSTELEWYHSRHCCCGEDNKVKQEEMPKSLLGIFVCSEILSIIVLRDKTGWYVYFYIFYS